MHTKLLISAVVLLSALAGAFWLSNIPEKLEVENPESGLISGSESDFEESIVVLSPMENEKVGSPFVLKGQAKVSGNRVTFILRSDNGSEISKDYAETKKGELGQLDDFEAKVLIPVSAASSEKLKLEVFNYSEDGSVKNLVSVPLNLGTLETMDINVYFTKSGSADCAEVFPIKRQILKTEETAYAALHQLIQGPNIGELGEYDTAIPGKTKINSITTRDETLYVDFDESLTQDIDNLCRMNAVKSQIEATLKQFESIKNVIISINGKVF